MVNPGIIMMILIMAQKEVSFIEIIYLIHPNSGSISPKRTGEHSVLF
jgi:hypothetical protein